MEKLVVKQLRAGNPLNLNKMKIGDKFQTTFCRERGEIYTIVRIEKHTHKGKEEKVYHLSPYGSFTGEALPLYLTPIQ